MPRLNLTVAQQFWAKVQQQGDCWLWMGTRSRGGYGRFKINRQRRTAHRWLYERVYGPVPTGRELDHLCRVRACVNPQYLEPVTRRENSLRGIGFCAVNARKTHCLRGHLLEGKNVYIQPKSGSRECMVCRKARKRAALAPRETEEK